MKKRVISVLVPDWLLKEIEKVAMKQGESKSAIIRIAVRLYLRKHRF